MRGLCPKVSRERLPAAAPSQPGRRWPDAEVLCWEARNAHLRRPSLPPRAGDASSKNGDIAKGYRRVFLLRSPLYRSTRGSWEAGGFALLFNFRTIPTPLPTPRDTRSSEFTSTRVVSAASACRSTQRPLKPVQRAAGVLLSKQRLQTQMPARDLERREPTELGRDCGEQETRLRRGGHSSGRRPP